MAARRPDPNTNSADPPSDAGFPAGQDPAIDERVLLARITALIEEEHELRRRSTAFAGLDNPATTRIHQIDEELDRCWELRRRVQALQAASEQYGPAGT